jgi:hypothetical protein
MCTEHGKQRLECKCYFLLIKHIDVYVHHCHSVVMHVYRARWTDGGLPTTIRDDPSVQDHCMGRGWLVSDSYELPHAYRAGWTDDGLPVAHLG